MIIDASQSAGVLPLDMIALGAAFIAMPGHKGLYGPQGTGVLLCGAGVKPAALLEGGTGSISIQQEMPDFLPDRLEAGTHNMPGIAGLLAGVRFVRRQGTEAICDQERRLTRRAAEGLRTTPGRAGLPAGADGAGGRAFPGAEGGTRRSWGSPGRAGDRRPGGTALRAAGPPHRRDVGHRDGAGELFRLQHAAGSGPVFWALREIFEMISEQTVNFHSVCLAILQADFI